MSTPKELIPFLQEMLAVFLNKFHDLVDLHAAETAGTLKYNRIFTNDSMRSCGQMNSLIVTR